VGVVVGVARCNEMSFWESFWPGLWSNALATLIGVGVGVPIALSIDRHFRFEARKVEKAENAERVRRLLQALGSSIEANVTYLRELSDAVTKKTVPLYVSFNAAVWEAVQTDAVTLLADPELQVLLATFFEDLREMSRLQRHLIDVMVGVGASIGGSAGVRDKLFGIIESGTKGMVERSASLLAEIERRKASVAAG